MSMTDTEQVEIEDLAEAKAMVQRIVRDWNWMTWNDLLADDVTLSLKLGAIGVIGLGDLAAAGGDLQVVGRDNAKQVLKSIYKELKAGVSVTTEVVSGYDFFVFGALQRQAADGTGMKSYPIATLIEFGPDELINNLTITAIDLYPLLEPIKSVAKTGALEPTATVAEPAKKVA